ncbi:MAG: DUF5618 family protein [Thermodesulfovibrionales bacterium]
MREAIRYFENAKELLSKSPIEDNTYTDIKYVQEACGTAYLAILKAIDEYLIARGVDPKDLPQSVEGYREMIRKYLTPYNGKLTREFEKLYKALHIAGYYRGLLEDVDMLKDAFKAAKGVIVLKCYS